MSAENSSSSNSSLFNSLENEIEELKKEKDALLLAHYYEEPEIQDIADEIGDSYFLARRGQEATNKVVLLAGVVFMAESVKILSPEKTVLAPDMDAGCSLVTGSPYDEYLKWRLEHPEAIAVTYVNSSAEVKSISDVICTSSNAEKIISAIPKDRKILFGPDRQLGKFIASRTGREMEYWNGACEVHMLFSAQKLYHLTKEHPDAVVVAHPECLDSVLQYAHVVGSTSLLLKTVQENPAKKFIVATETGILHAMKKSRPDAELIQAPADSTCACNDCPYMKLNTLEKIRDALKNLQPRIELDPRMLSAASISLQRMMDISEGKKVAWPDRFSAPLVNSLGSENFERVTRASL